MKKFEFNLQKVLDYKEILLKKTQRDLAFVENQVIEAQRELEMIQNHLEQYTAQLLTSRTETSSEIKLKYDYFYQLLDDIDAQRKNLTELKNKKEEYLSLLIQQLKDQKILAKLKDKQYQNYMDEMQKEEEIFLDEVAVIGSRPSST